MPGRRGELKYVDTGAEAVLSSAGALALLNGLTPGTGASQRIGKKALFKSILFRAVLAGGANGGTAFCGTCRMIIVVDRQANATAPAVTDILQSASGLAPINMDNRDRFFVLTDKEYPIDQLGGNQSADCKVYRRINLPTIYNAGTAGTVADISTNSMYLLTIYTQGGTIAAPTAGPGIDWTCRLRFDDS